MINRELWLTIDRRTFYLILERSVVTTILTNLILTTHNRFTREFLVAEAAPVLVGLIGFQRILRHKHRCGALQRRCVSNDGRCGLWQSNILQVAAAVEGIGTNLLDIGGNIERGESRAVLERIVGNLCERREILQLVEAVHHAATEDGTDCLHGSSLLEAKFAIVIVVPVVDTSGLGDIVNEVDVVELAAQRCDGGGNLLPRTLEVVVDCLFSRCLDTLLVSCIEQFL